MKLTCEQFARIQHLMPIPRRKAEIANYDFLCAILYIIENGCKWRALPKEYGNWHTIYVKLNRWSKNGTLERIFEAMQNEGIISIETTVVCLDSTRCILMLQER
jgi:transposase